MLEKTRPILVFTNASCNSKLPWPDNLKDKKSGQLNAFFRWRSISDTEKDFKISLFMISSDQLKTEFRIPEKATVDVSLRRLQRMKFNEGDSVKWSFGKVNGETIIGSDNIFTVKNLNLTSTPQTLSINK